MTCENPQLHPFTRLSCPFFAYAACKPFSRTRWLFEVSILYYDSLKNND